MTRLSLPLATASVCAVSSDEGPGSRDRRAGQQSSLRGSLRGLLQLLPHMPDGSVDMRRNAVHRSNRLEQRHVFYMS